MTSPLCTLKPMILRVNWSMTTRTQWDLRKMNSHRKRSTLQRLSFTLPMKVNHEGLISRYGSVVLGEDSPHDVFVDIDSKSPCDLLRDSGIPAPYLQNQLDEIGARSLGTGLASSFGGIEQPVFSFFESLMEPRNG